jgi:cobaltochelatase CobT
MEMIGREPVAFMSYVRSDDEHEFGSITKFRQRLEGEIRMQTGKPFAIFQDRNDILWGQHWEERIVKALSGITFLIPVITPSFFRSPSCRSEFEIFQRKETTLGVNRLVMPLYYVTCEELQGGYTGSDPIVAAIRTRNWADWRPFRFKELGGEEVRAALAQFALQIKESIRELESIAEAAAQIKTKETPSVVLTPSPSPPRPSQVTPPDIPVPVVRTKGPPKVAELERLSSLPYYVYTTRYDEVVSATELVGDNDELLSLQRFLSTRATTIRRIHSRYLNTLSKTFSNSGASIAITVLLDNSGSLRGDPILSLASWAMVLAEWFDRLGVTSELLGFTTRTWKGGQSRELWLTDGKPAAPGRLNDIRHIVYKAFEESATVAASNCAIMAREGLLKENIDGEALLWAYERLSRQSHPTKLLFIIADGQSVDDSTLSVNEENFLTDHLKCVSTWLSAQPSIKLTAIGLEHDLSPFYPDAVVATNRDIGIPVLRTVEAVLSSGNPPH